MMDGRMPRFREMHSKMVETAMHVFSTFKGMPDIFIGDHLHVSFNASTACPLHTTSSVTAVLQYKDKVDTLCRHDKDPFNISIGSGKAMCGDLGCSAMKRYNIVGKLPLWVGVRGLGRPRAQQNIEPSKRKVWDWMSASVRGAGP